MLNDTAGKVGTERSVSAAGLCGGAGPGGRTRVLRHLTHRSSAARLPLQGSASGAREPTNSVGPIRWLFMFYS